MYMRGLERGLRVRAECVGDDINQSTVGPLIHMQAPLVVPHKQFKYCVLKTGRGENQQFLLIFAPDFFFFPSLVLFLPFFTPLGCAFKCLSFESYYL